MAIICIIILCLGLLIAYWGGYCVVRQNRYRFYGALATVYGAAMIGLSLAFLLAI